MKFFQSFIHMNSHVKKHESSHTIPDMYSVRQTTQVQAMLFKNTADA